MGALVGAKPRVESQERSFLKGLVGKRLEEMTSGSPPVNPLELLGLTGSDPPPPPGLVLSATPSSVTITEDEPKPIPSSELVPLAFSPSPGETPKSESTIQSVYAESVTGNTDSVTVDLAPTDRIQTERSPHDSLHKDPSRDVVAPLQWKSDHPVVPGPGVRAPRLLQSPRHWVSVAWALHACRDSESPTMTRPVSYTELAQVVGRHEDSVRRTILQMIDNGLLVRTSLLQHSEGGSIYRFEEAFPSLLVVQSPPRTSTRAVGSHSLHDSLNRASSSSSSSFQKSSELLQEVPVDQLILSAPFEELDCRTLASFARQMPSLGYLQDFIDKVVAVIEFKKQSPKPIADPIAFLFGCLKKMEINPPPGWKSRAVRMLEEEERRLKSEAEELRAAGNRVERQRCEVYFLRLPPEKQAEILRETEAVGAKDIGMIQEAKREQRYLELIRERMRQDAATPNV